MAIKHIPNFNDFAGFVSNAATPPPIAKRATANSLSVGLDIFFILVFIAFVT